MLKILHHGGLAALIVIDRNDLMPIARQHRRELADVGADIPDTTERPLSRTHPVNIGNPVEMPIRYLVEKVLDKVGGRSKFVFEPPPVDDPIQRCSDITVAREKLKCAPKNRPRNGLTKTIALFDELLNTTGTSPAWGVSGRGPQFRILVRRPV